VRKEARRYAPGDGFIARVDSPYLPLEQAVWVTRQRYGETEKDLIRGAWNSEPLAFFRWFADLPAFDGMSQGWRVVYRPALSHARARGHALSLSRLPRRRRLSLAAGYFLIWRTKRSASCGWPE
jgi:hypothetical protein